MAPLQPEDGYNLCPSCLGLEHLREGLSEDPCMISSFMPCALRAANLAQVELLKGNAGLPLLDELTPAQTLPFQVWAMEAAGASTKKKNMFFKLSSRVDLLTSELAHTVLSLCFWPSILMLV